MRRRRGRPVVALVLCVLAAGCGELQVGEQGAPCTVSSIDARIAPAVIANSVAVLPRIPIAAKQIGYSDCLPRPLVVDADGLVDCEVRFELPTPDIANPGTPVNCHELSLSAPPPGEPVVGEGGGNLCAVSQLAVDPELRRRAKGEGISDFERAEVVAAIRASGAGFYYDDFSGEVLSACPQSRPRRIAYTEGVEPPQGTTVVLRCTLSYATAVEYDDLDDAFYMGLSAEPPGPGTPCSSVPDRVQSRQLYYDGLLRGDEPDYATVMACPADDDCGAGFDADVLCRVRLEGDMLDERMFCHPQSARCVRRCDTDDDCPTDWICDGDAAALAAGGEAICENPGCDG